MFFLVCMSVHPLHSILGSLKTLYILPHRILNILAPLYKPIWIDFSGKRLLIYERCWSAWLEATGTGARRSVLLFVQYYDSLFHLLLRYEYRTWKHGKKRREKLRRYLIIPTRQLKFRKNKLHLQIPQVFWQEEIHRRPSMGASDAWQSDVLD